MGQSSDFRSSFAGRKQGWFGAKAGVKRLVSLRIPQMGVRWSARFIPVSKLARLPAPASVREVVGRTDTGTFVMLSPDRCEIAKELYWGKGWRPRAEDALALDLVTRLCGSADYLFDVGAYTGVFSIAAAVRNPDLEVHAFEIVPLVRRLLDKNVVRNSLEQRVHVHLEGIGLGGTTMRVPEGTGGSALPSFYSSRMRFEDGVDIPFVSLDELTTLVGTGGRVVMKIDVEGTEADVFREGGAFLGSVDHVLCEVLHGIADVAALQELVPSSEFSYYLVSEQALLPKSHIVADPRFRDWLFSRKSPTELRAAGFPVAYE